ncbi:hypothetical protein OK016_01205 [Vibrio chagasii]|nr:hypothetical protein [Vibrio chagasii]
MAAAPSFDNYRYAGILIKKADGATQWSPHFWRWRGRINRFDQNNTGEQKLVVAEGSLYITIQGELRFWSRTVISTILAEISLNRSRPSYRATFDKDTVTRQSLLTITDGDIPDH